MSEARSYDTRPARQLVPALALAALLAAPAAAQRIELDGVVSRGDRAEIRRTIGYAARLSIPLLPFVNAAVGYSRMAGSGEIDGTSCGVDSPCAGERLKNNLAFGTVDYELQVPLRLLGLEVSAAAGVDVTTVERDELRGVETGQVYRAYAPEMGLLSSLTSVNGRHYRVGIGLSPLFGLPVTLRAAWQRRISDLDACAADAWSPLCGEMRADQLLFGVSVGTN